MKDGEDPLSNSEFQVQGDLKTIGLHYKFQTTHPILSVLKSTHLGELGEVLSW